MRESDIHTNPDTVFLLLVSFAVIMPMGIFLWRFSPIIESYLWAMTWSLSFPFLELDLFFFSAHPLTGLLYIPRLLFPVQMRRVYQGATTMRSAFWMGLAGELYAAVHGLFYSTVLFAYPFADIFLGIPTPIMLITGLLIYKYRPPPETTTEWLDGEHSEKELLWTESPVD